MLQQGTRFGFERRNPLEVSEVKGKDELPHQKGVLPPGEGSLAEVAPDNLIITAVKGAEDGNGLVFRIMEIAGRESEGRLTLPWMTVGSATEGSSVETTGRALGHDAHRVSFRLKAHEVLTMRIAAQ